MNCSKVIFLILSDSNYDPSWKTRNMVKYLTYGSRNIYRKDIASKMRKFM